MKSLTAVIERANGGGTQSYKYAPLSSGLDIVRKSLGKYELALIQTTHVDRERSLVLLTTTIAHGSGEWISGLWPVCTMADLAHPKLMGAALTYARRYCLFTMVGLAGEDDLDAPDLLTAKPLDAVANGPDHRNNSFALITEAPSTRCLIHLEFRSKSQTMMGPHRNGSGVSPPQAEGCA